MLGSLIMLYTLHFVILMTLLVIMLVPYIEYKPNKIKQCFVCYQWGVFCWTNQAPQVIWRIYLCAVPRGRIF
jgi:hypothetical protein